jgi:hypothetical protein
MGPRANPALPEPAGVLPRGAPRLRLVLVSTSRPALQAPEFTLTLRDHKMSRMTWAEYAEQRATERAEQVAKLLAPFEKRRAQLEGRQAHIQGELERLQRLPNPSDKITAQIAELAREGQTLRQVEAKLNEDEATARNTVARLRG